MHKNEVLKVIPSSKITFRGLITGILRWCKNKTKNDFVGNQKCLFLPPVWGIADFGIVRS